MFPVDNTNARRECERQVRRDGTVIWMTKKQMDLQVALLEQKELREMLATYDPWGKPGNGAPMPGALRKTKWMVEEPADGTEISATTLGRPGHGAPLRTISGKIRTILRSDPSIRFQCHESSRGGVDKDLRYRASPADKENYRKELDAIIKEKHKQQPDLSKGWTDEFTFRRLIGSLPKDGRTVNGGGVELVPLLAKNRIVNRSPLSSTDVTKISKITNGPSATVDEEYQRELSRQVTERQNMIQEKCREDLETSRKHFETWKGFWGRPGHGAPKALSQREKLDMILYHLPSLRNPSASRKKAN